MQKTVKILLIRKYLVPGDFTIAQFILIIGRRLALPPYNSLFLFHNIDSLPLSISKSSHVYEKMKDDDGFLYLRYAFWWMFWLRKPNEEQTWCGLNKETKRVGMCDKVDWLYINSSFCFFIVDGIKKRVIQNIPFGFSKLDSILLLYFIL